MKKELAKLVGHDAFMAWLKSYGITCSLVELGWGTGILIDYVPEIQSYYLAEIYSDGTINIVSDVYNSCGGKYAILENRGAFYDPELVCKYVSRARPSAGVPAHRAYVLKDQEADVIVTYSTDDQPDFFYTEFLEKGAILEVYSDDDFEPGRIHSFRVYEAAAVAFARVYENPILN